MITGNLHCYKLYRSILEIFRLDDRRGYSDLTADIKGSDVPSLRSLLVVTVSTQMT